MFEFLTRRLERRSYIAGFFNLFSPGVGSWPVRNFRQLVDEGYKANPTAYSCIDQISTACAGIPWKVYQRSRGGRLVELTKHPLLDLIARPNPEQSWADLQKWSMSDYLLDGNEYELKLAKDAVIAEGKPLTQAPAQIWCIQPGSLEAVPNAIGQLQWWRLRTATLFEKLTGAARDIHPSRIIHRKTYNPLSRFFGMSPLEAAARDVDTMNAGLKYNYGLLNNGGRPDGLIMVKGRMEPAQKKEAQAQIDESFNDPSKAGRWKLLEGAQDVSIQQLAVTPKDMEFKEGRIANAIAICTVFNVPPEIIGIQGQKTYSNYQEARKAFYEECILPHMDSKQERYNRDLVPLFGDRLYLGYDKDAIEALQEDRDKKFERAGKFYTAGLWTANESREYVGSDPADDELADERMLPLSQTPASEFMASQGTQDPNLNPDGTPVDPNAPPPAAPKDPGNEDPPKAARRETRALQGPLFMLRNAHGPTAFKAFDRRRAVWLATASRIYKTALVITHKSVAAEIRKLGAVDHGPITQNEVEPAIRRGIGATTKAWTKAYTAVYMAVGQDFAAAVHRGLTDTIKGISPATEIKAGEDAAAAEWERRIAKYLAQEGGRRITEVFETTRKKIMATLAEGFKNGEGSDELAARVDYAAGFQTSRSLTIARTEVITSSNLGSQVAAESFGVPLEKTWLGTDDDRERETHAEAEGQTVSLNDTFSVGGDSLMFPGDSSQGASPGETINCRCTQTYSPAGSSGD